MRQRHRPTAVAHATRQRALGVTSLLCVLGLYAAVVVAPFVVPAITGIGAVEALRLTVLFVGLVHGLLAVALLR